MGLMNKVNQIDENFSCLSDNNKVSLLLYGDSKRHINFNISIVLIVHFVSSDTSNLVNYFAYYVFLRFFFWQQNTN